MSRSFTGTRLFLRKQLWIWPVIAAVLLSVIGFSVRSVVEDAVKSTMAENLKTILNADVEALRIWLETKQSDAVAVATDDEIVELIKKLTVLAAAENADTVTFLQAPELAELRTALAPQLEAHDYDGFAVIDSHGRIVAAARDELVGKTNLPVQKGLFQMLFEDGSPVVTRPAKSIIVLENEQGEPQAGMPTMFAVAPVQNSQDEIIAAIGLRIRPQGAFTRILSVARAGTSGETYAFDEQGLLISQSRFDDELKQIGLLVDAEDSPSILNIQIRDPQVNMTLGQRPTHRRADQPLTKMAADSINNKPNFGSDIDGYRDYRGVPVIGAWTWLDEYGFGVTTEVDVAEAYRPLYLLRYTFWSLFGLLGLSAIAILVFTVIVARLNRRARRDALHAKQLGQYSLDEQIGAGAMGVVYRGHHEMLRRPTAIKLLDIEKTTDRTIARFEREVRLTSQLNHPNTIAVYDYGRTPEGVFYYAMEYLDGFDLQQFIDQFGPQPEGRVIRILRQVCGSLHEAHGVGLIHRDIKPANIILNERGGMYDVIKLLDFGLVKAVDTDREKALTAADSLTGTPLYLSPEGIERPNEVDARSDLYAVGAVGYFLLTGQPVFDGSSIVEICMQHVKQEPARPSERLGKPIAADLEDVILKCLAKEPADRPQNAMELMTALAACGATGDWSGDDAKQWWVQHAAADEVSASTSDTSAEARTLIVDSDPADETSAS